MPRYEFSEGSSNKFWEIQLSGASFTTTYGKIGTPGQTTLKEFSTEAAAKKEYEKLVAEKVKKGYVAVGGGKAAAKAPAKAPPKAEKPAPVQQAPAPAPAPSPSATPGARYFEFVEGSSSKFWEIALDGNDVKTRYGKIGTPGQSTLKEFDSKTEAFKEYDKLVAEKTKKGYREIAPTGQGGGSPGADARNPELEKAIAADPYDTAAYTVLADWLQEQGDPRGELIALQLAGKDKQAKALIEKQSAYFLGPLAPHQHTYDGEKKPALIWKYGYIHALRLSHNHYAEEGFEGSLAEVLDLVLRHPSGRFVAEISFGFNNDPNESDLQDLIDLLAKRAPPTIRKLHFGEYKFAGGGLIGMGGDETEISWYSIGNLSKLWKAVPGLRTLITQGGSADSAMAGGTKLGTIELPNLTHAEFRTGGLEKASAKAIAAAAIPKIEHLDIWYGDDNYGGNATIKDVLPLLARTDLKQLRHLGLMNAEFTDELGPALAVSPVLRQLRELDLSMGCLTDAGAAELARHRDAFAHLDKLDVSYNLLTKAGITALKGCAKTIVAKSQREDDPEYRHPAVGE